MNWVFEQSPTTANDRLVLIAIADEADDDGTNAYPSVDRIAMKARLNKRTTMRCLERLEAAGELIVHRPEKRGRGHYNTYVVVMEKGDNLSPIGTARKGDTESEKGRETARSDAQSVLDPLTLSAKALDPRPASRATRIADPFLLTPSMQQWAASDVPTVDVRAETAKFVDHFRGSGTRKLDWEATWRNWMRRAAENKHTGGSARPSRSERTAAAIDNVRAMFPA